jgi:hypothetical protein
MSVTHRAFISATTRALDRFSPSELLLLPRHFAIALGFALKAGRSATDPFSVSPLHSLAELTGQQDYFASFRHFRLR